ncbi:MAG: GTPase ObgE [Oscillospiraceae bacterium]
MFSDIARIFIKAGDGGNGAVTFHREKYIASGGPDGGDGGKGGSVIFIADKNISTLMDFKYKRKYIAENGGNGRDSNCSGKMGEDLEIKVPMGTLVRDADTNKVIIDLREDGERFAAAKGGGGGWGNSHFATSTRQVPRFSKPGTPGEERMVTLELKIIADVGLLGFPNVGKSTFLSIISDARPKIANYHFTTLQPNLGVVDMGEGAGFVVADIPGVIEGAHAGVGLGHEFLRHVERTRVLLHIVDVSGIEGRDPLEDFRTINRELELYSPKLAKKPQIVLANKSDIPSFYDNFDNFKKELEEMGYKVFEISAATRKGIKDVVNYTYEQLKVLPTTELEDDYEILDLEEERRNEDTITVTRVDGVFVVEGLRARKIVGSTNLGDYESLQYFQRALIKSGIIAKLKKAGINEGDTVHIYGAEFDYVD